MFWVILMTLFKWLTLKCHNYDGKSVVALTGA